MPLAPTPQDPASLEGLSLATIALAAAGNAMMVPRALWTRDVIWTTGSLWGSLIFGWAQMLSLCVGRSPASGTRFLGVPAFLAATALLWAWFAFVLAADSAAKGRPHPLQALRQRLAGAARNSGHAD